MTRRFDSTRMSRVVGQTLTQLGLFKARGGWVLEGAGGLGMLSLQASNYSHQYYVNIGFWPENDEPRENALENQFPVRARLTSIFSNDRDMISEAFDFDNEDLSSEQRKKLIRSILEELAVPFLRDIVCINGLESMYEADRLKGAAIWKETRERLLTRIQEPR